MPSREHYQNAGNPAGEYGSSMLDTMNSGTHEQLALWALPLLSQRVARQTLGQRAQEQQACAQQADAQQPAVCQSDSHQSTEKTFSPTMSIVDLGCGGGANLARHHALFPQAQLAGLDHSPVSVEKSKRFNASLIKQGLCDVTAGDVGQLPYADASASIVTAFETTYFWLDLEQAFTEVLRILKPGGIFVIINETDGRSFDQLRWNDFTQARDLLTIYSQEQLDELLRKAGFSSTETCRHPSEDWIEVFAYKEY